MATFAEMLRRLREREGWTQKELAQRLGISGSAISMYERGAREPDFKTLQTVADVFGVSAGSLLDEGPKKEASEILSIEEEVEHLLSSLSYTSPVTIMLDGKPASPEAIAALKSALAVGVAQARQFDEERAQSGEKHDERDER